MTQKKSQTSAKTNLPIEGIVQLNQAYAQGNFAAARSQAKALLRNPTASDTARQAAEKMLKMTGIDPLAVVAGLLCMAFTSIVAFLVR